MFIYNSTSSQLYLTSSSNKIIHDKARTEDNSQIVDFVMVPMSLVQKSNKQKIYAK